jgi:hypothetical protein
MQINRELTPQERVQALIAQAAATQAPEAPEPAPEPQAPQPVSLVQMAQANHANLMELGRMVQVQSQVIEAIAEAVGEIHRALYQPAPTQRIDPELHPQQFDSDF